MLARNYVPKGADYVVTKPLRKIPGRPSKMELLAVGETHGVPEPKWPFGDDPTAYAEELQDTMDAMEQARKGSWPAEFFAKYARQSAVAIDWDFSIMPEPLARAGVDKSDPMRLPELVTMDVPYQIRAELWHWSVEKAGGIPNIEIKAPTVPGHTEFNEIACGYDSRGAARIYRRMQQVAAVKNFYALMRPETVICELIKPYRMPAAVFTTADQGCPPHDSYPAGHGTFDGAAAFHHENEIVLSPTAVRESRAACFIHAMGRSILGVHTPQDNIRGFELGFGVYDDEPSITAEEFFAARAASETGDVDLSALIEQKRVAMVA